ncbi:MAG: tyrosine-type recombinase/integrase, partial [Myxococcales bacterium]|nr:tyrosine-type recombinase/integrase [Myxococcales bacterium]
EAEAVLAQPDVADPLGVRDRAILELLYSTGIRRTELTRLQLFDLDWVRGTLRVREGKGDKERVVPVGERALAWCEKYLREVRPTLLYGKEEGWLFLTRRGDGFTPNGLTKLAGDYVEAAGLGKPGACHLFRHTMATAMLENGADIRYIQEMLGHAQLETTQIYTRVSIHKLKEIHTATHPSAKLGRRERAGEQDLPEDLQEASQ